MSATLVSVTEVRKTMIGIALGPSYNEYSAPIYQSRGVRWERQLMLLMRY